MFTQPQLVIALSHLGIAQSLLGYEDDYKMQYDTFAIVLLHSECHDFEPQPDFSAYDHVAAVWIWYIKSHISTGKPGAAEKGLDALRGLTKRFKGPKFLTSKEVMVELELALAALEPATTVLAP